MPPSIAENLASIQAAIERAAARAGREPGEVTIVGAVKTVPVDAIRTAFELGVTNLGENFVRELRDRAPRFPDARWHYIGTLQSGTAHHVADLADVVETLSSERATERLARRAAAAGRTIDALIEVDFTGERSGTPPERTASLADRVASLEGLRLVGLMTVPPIPTRAEDSRASFARLRELRDRIRDTHADVLELSMGMSLDYEVAVEEGATMVRIGTALFGERPT
ncbi:MAG TPA: YggS family pyridoxal phosphate-dependent enzyme [Actinomycetota bacterium]